jgi:probable rRNA maturation factor
MKISNVESSLPQIPEQDEEPPSLHCNVELELTVDDDIKLPLDASDIEAAVRAAATREGFLEGTIGVRVTDDVTIRQLNAKHLGHDYATDVISFGYEADPPRVEGELVASVDTATQKASEVRWPVKHELLLYIVHGVLHICGMDDHQEHDRAAMREAEKAVFLELGIDEISRCGADKQNGESQ